MESTMENDQLSDEQRKRLDLLEAYEKDTGPERQARNEALEKHDAAFTEKWMSLQSEIELKRAQSIERLRAEGHGEQQVQSMVAAEVAAMTEGFMAEKDHAARSLDLATPQSWHDWLVEKKRLHPEDPTFDSLIEEAKTMPALDGFLKSPPPEVHGVRACAAACERWPRGLHARHVGGRHGHWRTSGREAQR